MSSPTSSALAEVTSGQALADEVAKFLGDPYVYGAAGPNDFDCSGLIYYAANQLGYTGVPRTSEEQWSAATNQQSYSGNFGQSQVNALQPGTLVFSQWPGDDASPGHVAVYAGGGNIIEAPSPGLDVHEIPLDSSYWPYVTGTGNLPGSASAAGLAQAGTGDSIASDLGLGSIGDLANDFTDFAKIMGDFLKPTFWVSVGSLVTGIVLFIIALFFLGKAAIREVPS